ncbi:lytic polysaccharide monooxygenase [Arsenophonus apicola]|uniref:Lytic polysaccharide monooxygenase n=1 Tax=Arsenophonus apicola TaxID=2879119 RepID=A0ABY8NZ20_9GAMM|nr:lytic polysaccharide monooxygenase [Arsenophonus apicola]WGO82485.1 lytic polysaccharide monooxygenase [Arsenophonus apicola]
MKIKLSFAMLSLAILVLISVVSFAGATTLPTPMHGYIDFPASRPYLCSLGKNGNCGAVMVEPQSVEGRKGFPRRGPADGKIASAGHRWFGELDEQSATRWTKVDVSPGKNTFHWTLTAPHRTTGWEYFITKQDWDPNAPLARSSFDLQPFCSRTDGGEMPSFEVTIDCNVPYRTGYQVILGVWTIYDTGNAFYQVIDANMKP